LLAIAQTRRVSGRDFIAAAVAGYEVGAVIGRALIDPTLARIHRPTGITGPIAAAAALARLISLDPAQTATAICLAANTIAGFNEWAHTGGSDMYFQAGFASRSAIYAVRLAAAGAFASATALDGPAGLFAALGKRDQAAGVTAFRNTPEILSVYHKPAAGCNFAQTACQAALILANEHALDAHEIEHVTVRLPRAALLYPGCDHAGPFASMLQAKMSIQYNVACALAGGGRLPAASEQVETAAVGHIAARIMLREDTALTAAYPQRQGAAVEVALACGSRFATSLDDVVTASPDQVRLRFLDAAAALFGAAGAQAIQEGIADMEEIMDVGALAAKMTLAPCA
jgi:2-methylcitrate dehydratase PrpD